MYIAGREWMGEGSLVGDLPLGVYERKAYCVLYVEGLRWASRMSGMRSLGWVLADRTRRDDQRSRLADFNYIGIGLCAALIFCSVRGEITVL